MPTLLLSNVRPPRGYWSEQRSFPHYNSVTHPEPSSKPALPLGYLSDVSMFTAMFPSRLPIELCELIIDCVRDPQALPWWARLQLVFQIRWHAKSPTDLEQAHLHTLRACALTCSSWLPRARANLFHTVVFEDQEDVDRFVCSIAENHRLADFVRELVVDFAGGYVPFAQGTLVKTLRRVRTVVFPLLGVSTWHYPPRHQLLVAQLPLTELVFDVYASDYRMVVYAFSVVWSARALERLTIMFSGHPPAFTEAQVRRIGVLRRRWSCGQLMTLAASVRERSEQYERRRSLLTWCSGSVPAAGHGYLASSTIRHRSRAGRHIS